jgi:hypothetical protein
MLGLALKKVTRKAKQEWANEYITAAKMWEVAAWRHGRRLLRSVGRIVQRGRWGVCPECRQGVERICRAITKQVQRSDARIEVDVMHTRG